jgi:hypothetical protein
LGDIPEAIANKVKDCISGAVLSRKELVAYSTDNFSVKYEKNKSVLVKTPWLLVRKQTIPTERPPLVGEVSVNFCG